MSKEIENKEIVNIKDTNNELKEDNDENMKIMNETYKKFNLITYNIEELNKFKDNILSILKERDKIYLDKLFEYKAKTEKIQSDFDSTNKISNSKFSNIIDNQAQMTSRLDQLNNYESFVHATNDKLISHEVRINNMREDFSNATQKYDKIYLDNLELPGYIGRCAKYKNCQNFFLDVIKNLAKLNQYREKNIIDLKMYKDKLETIINSMNSILDNNNEAQIKYINETKEKILKDCNNMFESVRENMKEIRVDNSKYAVDLISQSMDLSKKWDKIEKIREDLLEKFNYSVNKYQMLTDDTIKSFDEFKGEYGVIRRKFMELAEFIKDVRFRRNIGENVKKKEIKEMAKKMVRRKKSFDGKDVQLLNDISSIENIDYKKYYNVENINNDNNDDIRSNSLKLIKNQNKEKSSEYNIHSNKYKKNKNYNSMSKESIYKKDLNQSVEESQNYRTNIKHSLNSSTRRNNNTDINNRSINISPMNLKNIKNNINNNNKSAIINNNANINYKKHNNSDIKFTNDLIVSERNKENNKGKNEIINNSKEKIECIENDKKDDIVIYEKNNENKYNLKPNEICTKINEINYDNRTNEINYKNSDNIYNINSDEKDTKIKDNCSKDDDQNNNLNEEELIYNKNNILLKNKIVSEQQQFNEKDTNNKDRYTDNKGVNKDINKYKENNNYKLIPNISINIEKNDIQNQINDKNVVINDEHPTDDKNKKKNEDISSHIYNKNIRKIDSIQNYDKNIKKRDENSQIILNRSMSNRSNIENKPSLIDDVSIISEGYNTNINSVKNNNNIGLSSEKSLSFISDNNNNNINKFLMNDIHIENNDKIIKELASELEQSTAKKDKLASNKKEIEQKFKNACSNIEPINLLGHRENNIKSNFNSNLTKTNNDKNNNGINYIDKSNYDKNNNDINNNDKSNYDKTNIMKLRRNININIDPTHINNEIINDKKLNHNVNNDNNNYINNDEIEKKNINNNDNYIEIGGKISNYNVDSNNNDINTNINVNELQSKTNDEDNNSNINIVNQINNKSIDDLQYKPHTEENNKYKNNNSNLNTINRSVNESINNLNPIKLNNEIYINDNFNSNTFNKKLHAVDQKLLNLELYTKEKILDLISQINLIKHTCKLPINESFTREKTNLDISKISYLSNKTASNPKYKTFNSNLINNQNNNNEHTPFCLERNKEHISNNNINNNKENNKNINNIINNNNSKSQFILNNITIDKKRYSLRAINPKSSVSNQKISKKNKIDYIISSNKYLDNNNNVQNNNLTENNGLSDSTMRLGNINDVIDGNNKKIIQSINNDINNRILKEFENKIDNVNLLKNNNDNNKDELNNKSMNKSINYGTNNFAYNNSKFKGTEIKLVDLNKLVEHQLPRNRLIPIKINNSDYFISLNNK